jgi:hypothetical protein
MARTKFSSPCLSQDGQTLDPVDLIGFLRPRMAHFMVPRFVRILADLPKTPTNKVGKYLLRKDGVAPDTFDRDAAGIVIKSEATRSPPLIHETGRMEYRRPPRNAWVRVGLRFQNDLVGSS